MQLRPIAPQDNPATAELVRAVLTEYGANRPGFAWQDPELDNLSAAYAGKHSAYFVLEYEGQIVGAGGYAPFDCELARCGELQKMYLYPQARGKGWGRQLIEFLIDDMQRQGFRHCYLETLASMREAVRLYEQQGFQRLQKPLGNSGHNACDQWYVRSL